MPHNLKPQDVPRVIKILTDAGVPVPSEVNVVDGSLIVKIPGTQEQGDTAAQELFKWNVNEKPSDGDGTTNESDVNMVDGFAVVEIVLGDGEDVFSADENADPRNVTVI